MTWTCETSKTCFGLRVTDLIHHPKDHRHWSLLFLFCVHIFMSVWVKMPFTIYPNDYFMIKETLNARRLLCPLPVIRTQDKVKKMQVGDQLEVICTDSGVMQDIPAWCRINGHKVLEATATSDYEYIIVLEVGA